MARIILVVVLVALLAGCGGDDGSPGPGAAAAEDVDMEHVHAVATDPADGAILLATHTGLFRLAEGSDIPERVGDSRQDTMGFTVVGPGTFLGSGHPDPRSGLPDPLGLVRSEDGGRTWRTVSLDGRADFHVLRARGTRVVGVDARGGALLVSDDGGRTWDRRATPAGGVVDLVVHPLRPDTLVAATRSGTAISRDGGRTWRARPGPAALMDWPSPRALYRVDAGGDVAVSADGGATWTGRGSVGDQPAALSADAGRLLVATHAGRLLESADRGATWEIRADLG